MNSDGSGPEKILPPQPLTGPAVIYLWNGNQSTFEGPQISALGTAGTISITTPTNNWIVPQPIIGAPIPAPPTPRIYSSEGKRIYNLIAGPSNFGVALYERWMTAAQLEHYPRVPCSQRILIPATTRSRLGEQYGTPWTETENYNGNALPSQF